MHPPKYRIPESRLRGRYLAIDLTIYTLEMMNMLATNRRNLLVGSVVTALAARTAGATTPVASPATAARLQCGINYDLGSELARGELTRPASHEQFFRDELTAIRDQLHATHVGLFGSEPTTVISGLETAADLGLDIRIQSRLNFIEQSEMVERLQAVAKSAETVRQNGTQIVLDVGCEYMIFADGMIPGDDFFEKVEAIESGDLDWEAVTIAMYQMLELLADTARSEFGGLLTYSDTPTDAPFWDAVDIVGIDHYLGGVDSATYLDTITMMASQGKPVWINEFGSTANRGAPEGGGMEWNIVEWEASPPQIIDGVVRDEAKQAHVILDTLELASQSPAERAYLYEFISTGSPRSEDPKFDWDLTGYGVVAIWGEEHEQPYESTGFWEPKAAFHEIAEWNVEHGGHAR
ncbi:MAG: hypothetical protein KF883_08550 [Thermomicrobiales bacterium]|nr:hypothetical protein [Thermomicrobiales bacterium]